MKKYLSIIIVSILCVIAIANNNIGASEKTTMKIRIKVGKEVLTATMLVPPLSAALAGRLRR